MGTDAMSTLGLTAEDRLLVSITLCHAFGIGSAVGSAFQAERVLYIHLFTRYHI